ncbi:hypothetical protein [Bacillus sp. FJAT-45037]|uniref:hypothetical protein n=1 Tax=Bacillus sp. FJAT-45037 TaxID=2011007 RepID=UPI0012FDF645|nr:hypothetical protein [Bacillus sp. FJAT-45037]
MSIRKQLAITELKAAVLQVAHDIESESSTGDELIKQLKDICNMLDDEIQVKGVNE